MAAGELHLPLAGFTVVRRGFDPAQVAEHLHRLEAELRILAADRDAAVDQVGQLTYQLDAARSDAEKLQAQLARLAQPPESVEGMSERLQWMLQLAQDEVAEMRSQANTDAAAIIAEAEEHGARSREELSRLRDELNAEHAAAMADVGRMHGLAQQEQARLMEHAQAKRDEADEDFMIALSARRKETSAELTATTEAARAEAAAMLEQAATDSAARIAETDAAVRRRIDDAQREVNDLRALRSRIAEQLRSMQAVLNRAAPALEPLDEESSAGQLL